MAYVLLNQWEARMQDWERQAQCSETNERRDCGDWGPLIQVELDKDLFQAIALIAKYWRLWSFSWTNRRETGPVYMDQWETRLWGLGASHTGGPWYRSPSGLRPYNLLSSPRLWSLVGNFERDKQNYSQTSGAEKDYYDVYFISIHLHDSVKWESRPFQEIWEFTLLSWSLQCVDCSA